VTDLHRAGQKGRARRVADKAPLKGMAKKRLKALAKGGPNLATTSLGDVPPDRVHEVRRAIEAGRLDDARDLLDPLIADWPDVAFLHNMRGIIHMESGSNGAAEQAFRRALTLSPGFAEAQANLGAALSRTGQIREAVEVLSAAFSANPFDYAAKYNLADALYQAGRLNEARILGEEIRDQSPDNNDVLTHLARVYGGMGEHQRVVETIQKVWASRPVDMGEVQNYVTSVDALEGIDAALKVLDEIEECDEQQRIKALFLGRAGRLDEAVEISRRLIERNPNDGARYRRYGSFKAWLPDNPLIDDMRALWAKRQSSRQDRVELGFALSKALDDIGDYSEGFGVISETNRLQKQEVAIPPSDPGARVDRIAKHWDRAAISSLRREGSPEVACIYIVGMPRTGSTLIETMIGQHPKVYELGEDEFAVTSVRRLFQPTAENVSELSRVLRENLRARSNGYSVVTDKHLGNAYYLGPLSAALPNAKFVLVRRNPRAICLSIFQNRMRPNGHSYSMDLEDLGHHYVAFDRLMTHWKSVLGPELIEVHYEDLVTDPETQTRKLIADLDLPWDDACLSPEKSTSAVRTLSIGQVRQGFYDSSRDRWRNYEEELQPLIRILEDHGL